MVGCSENRALVTKLRTEFLENPIGIDQKHPRFSWQIESKERGVTQTAYQIDVSKTDGTEVWSTGKIVDGHQHNIHYEGTPLEARTEYQWKVKFWDGNGNASSWSDIARFETGMQENKHWQGTWIFDGKPVPTKPEDFYQDIPNPIFRKDFKIEKAIGSARLYIAGLGYYEASLNGKKVGDRVLEPGWTNYDKEVLYSIYDISPLLEEGENTIGVSLGNGWYNPLPLRLFAKFNLREHLAIGTPKLIGEIHLTYTDGSEEVIPTDTSWKVSEGSILRNNVYLGEKIDARKEPKNWDNPNFKDSHWMAAKQAVAPKGKLVAQRVPPIRITKEIAPIAITEPEPQVYVVDFGQNLAGWIQMDVNAKKGQTLSFRYGELVHENGLVNAMTGVAGHIKEIWNMKGGPGAPKTAYQEDTYIARGEDGETFRQTFTFHGFRYVELRGYDKKPALDEIRALRLNSDVQQAGIFECSNPLFNKIQEVTDWTFKSNIFSIQSDCPAREKFGYGADIITAAEAYMFNYWMPNFYEKTVRDFAHDQRKNGGMPETAPFNGIDTQGLGEGSGPIGWQLAHPFVQEKLYTFYGDKDLIEKQYPHTVQLLDHLEQAAGEDLYIERGIGDHVSLTPKSVPLTSTAFLFHNATLAARFAKILGKEGDSAKYALLADNVKKAFIERFYDASTKQYDSLLTQANQVFPLFYGLFPTDDENQIKDLLIKDIVENNKGHLNTGIFATKMLFDLLQKYNESEVAYHMVNTKEFPGYGYMLEEDATTLWETWKFPGQNSVNHPMFGSVSEWFFRSVLGINQTDSSVAFSEILIQPRLTNQLEWAKGSYDALPGKIAVAWEKGDKNFTLAVSIPANTMAQVAIPIFDEQSTIKEKNGYTWGPRQQEGNETNINFLKKEDGYAFFKLGSGQYDFEQSW